MGTCAVETCRHPPYARGWCQMHHKRWQRHGDPLADRPKRGTEERRCAVETCPNPVDARGLCHGHYQQLLRGGDARPDEPLRERGEPDLCSVVHEGKQCTRPRYARRLCAAHYKRLKKHGDVLAHLPVRGGGCLTHGYRKVPVRKHLRHLTNGETSTTEHRLVMAIHLGRPLRADETVHHVNGLRTDNRIENLELWSSAHPKGQRVEDKVAFALDVLRRYARDLLIPDMREDTE